MHSCGIPWFTNQIVVQRLKALFIVGGATVFVRRYLGEVFDLAGDPKLAHEWRFRRRCKEAGERRVRNKMVHLSF